MGSRFLVAVLRGVPSDTCLSSICFFPPSAVFKTKIICVIVYALILMPLIEIMLVVITVSVLVLLPVYIGVYFYPGYTVGHCISCCVRFLRYFALGL